MHIAGVVLCGGHSKRMGLAKATLPFGSEPLVGRVVRLLSTVARPVVVVAAAGQELPWLSADVPVVHDRREARGPLEGLLAGLSALASYGDAAAAGMAGSVPKAAYVTGCDVPLLMPAFIERMAELLGDADVAAPYVGDRYHPLAAVYRTTVVPHIEALLAEDRLRPVFLYDRVKTRVVTEDELRAVDPALATLRNVNEPADYLAALAESGFAAPPEIVRALKRAPDGELTTEARRRGEDK
ncbi:MAG: molybdenum cofactor guanylyltransferase [Planctomycetia bacterium]|nr:molybdenum cofactor guanylyltransferase [Planctomycetia bacterium]